MSAVWSPLLPLAMVGTDRMNAAFPQFPGAVGELVAQVAGSSESPALGALRAAAILATCDLAGAHGGDWPAPMPIEAADDATPALADPRLISLVAWALDDGPARLQHDVLLVLARHGMRLPPFLLPHALELGRRSVALRPPLLPVLGQRGLWLAGQRDDWRYAAGTSTQAVDESPWSDGNLEQRRVFFLRERAADPAAARERLRRSLDELAAKERAETVAALALGLSLDDEPLLDTLRSDRAREVRQAALDLLLRLPDAAHPRRAAARLEPLLKFERVLLRKKWQIDAPASAGADWKADNLDPARPKNHVLGERAWWLYQLVRQVPLGWWTGHTGMGAADLRRWAAGTDWADALLLGWRDVLFAAPEPSWCEAFLDDWPATTLRDDAATVLALLPLAARERHWLTQLDAGALPLAAVVHQILAASSPGEPVSAALSTKIVASLSGPAASGDLGKDHAMRAQLPELACALSLGMLDRLVQLPRHADDPPSLADAWLAATQVAAVRQALHSPNVTRTP